MPHREIMLVVGAGVTGKSIGHYLTKRNISFSFYVDTEPEEELSAPVFVARVPDEFWASCTRVVKSPGISFEHPVVREAFRRDRPVLGEIDLVWSDVRARVIAVTGTKGKTTTTLLLTHLLNAAGKRAVAAGNVGTPISSVVDEPYDYIVLESSSFQIEEFHLPKFEAVIVLNITEDHLDRYQDRQAYFQAKAKIVSFLKIGGILIADLSLKKELESKTPVQTRTQWITDSATDRANGWLEPDAILLGDLYGKRIESLRKRQFKVVGDHNFYNLIACLLLLRDVNVVPHDLPAAVNSFVWPPHRLEYIGEYLECFFFNDSKSTSPLSTIAALKSFTQPVTLILGGQAKGLDFGVLNAYLEFVRVVVVQGSDRDRILSHLHTRARYYKYETLAEALENLPPLLHRGDVVLFSPACASFDQFNNYAERGDFFREAVKRLAQKVAERT